MGKRSKGRKGVVTSERERVEGKGGRVEKIEKGDGGRDE